MKFTIISLALACMSTYALAESAIAIPGCTQPKLVSVNASMAETKRFNTEASGYTTCANDYMAQQHQVEAIALDHNDREAASGAIERVSKAKTEYLAWVDHINAREAERAQKVLLRDQWQQTVTDTEKDKLETDYRNATNKSAAAQGLCSLH